MTLALSRYQIHRPYLKYVLDIFLSYLLFVIIIAFFGKGFSASASLGIALFSCGIAIIFNIYRAQNTIFKQVDYFFIGTIFIVQILIGIIHFDHIVNPNYFSADVLGVDINYGTYYRDIGYFAYLIDLIAEYRIEEGFFASNTADGLFHKNYFLAYLISDLFYFGDAYILNILAINLLAIFYSGVLLALIANKLFHNLDINKRRMVFYLTIMQPIAWIPSHTMRDIFGAFIVILSISLILFSVTKIQKILFGLLSLALVFQHRSAYVISMFGSILVSNYPIFRVRKTAGTLMVLVLFIPIIYLISSTNILQQFLALLFISQENSMLSGAVNDRNANIIEHSIKLIVGPFPWTQYFDGSVEGYAGFYSTTAILQAAWHLTIIYFLTMKIKMIIFYKNLRRHLYVVILFAFPATLSLGGMNMYLLPASMLSLVFLQMISLNRFLKVFLTVIGIYICMSALFYIIRI